MSCIGLQLGRTGNTHFLRCRNILDDKCNSWMKSLILEQNLCSLVHSTSKSPRSIFHSIRKLSTPLTAVYKSGIHSWGVIGSNGKWNICDEFKGRVGICWSTRAVRDAVCRLTTFRKFEWLVERAISLTNVTSRKTCGTWIVFSRYTNLIWSPRPIFPRLGKQ